jgi:hypothetical protein
MVSAVVMTPSEIAANSTCREYVGSGAPNGKSENPS